MSCACHFCNLHPDNVSTPTEKYTICPLPSMSHVWIRRLFIHQIKQPMAASTMVDAAMGRGSRDAVGGDSWEHRAASPRRRATSPPGKLYRRLEWQPSSGRDTPPAGLWVSSHLLLLSLALSLGCRDPAHACPVLSCLWGDSCPLSSAPGGTDWLDPDLGRDTVPEALRALLNHLVQVAEVFESSKKWTLRISYQNIFSKVLLKRH